ncbi:MAG: hypothetical protein ACRCWQ_10030 [Bacilli bacterium]
MKNKWLLTLLLAGTMSGCSDDKATDSNKVDDSVKKTSDVVVYEIVDDMLDLVDEIAEDVYDKDDALDISDYEKKQHYIARRIEAKEKEVDKTTYEELKNANGLLEEEINKLKADQTNSSETLSSAQKNIEALKKKYGLLELSDKNDEQWKIEIMADVYEIAEEARYIRTKDDRKEVYEEIDELRQDMKSMGNQGTALNEKVEPILAEIEKEIKDNLKLEEPAYQGILEKITAIVPLETLQKEALYDDSDYEDELEEKENPLDLD